jgi:hypothetical protein
VLELHPIRLKAKDCLSDRDAKDLAERLLTRLHYNPPVLGGLQGRNTIVFKPNGETLLVYLRCPPGVMQPLKDALKALRAAAAEPSTNLGGLYSGVMGFQEPTGGREASFRPCVFNLKYPDLWKSTQPLLRVLDGLGSSVPQLQTRHALQRAAWKIASPRFRIAKTNISTVTVNREASDGAHARHPCHRHLNNLPNGLSTMTTYRTGSYSGGLFVLPQWKVAIDMMCGDVVLFDGWDWHGNTRFVPGAGRYERVSVVSYFRTAMMDSGK